MLSKLLPAYRLNGFVVAYDHSGLKSLFKHPKNELGLFQLGLGLRKFLGTDVRFEMGALQSALQELNVVLLVFDAFLLCCHKLVGTGRRSSQSAITLS